MRFQADNADSLVSKVLNLLMALQSLETQTFRKRVEMLAKEATNKLLLRSQDLALSSPKGFHVSADLRSLKAKKPFCQNYSISPSLANSPPLVHKNPHMVPGQRQDFRPPVLCFPTWTLSS